MKLIKKHLLILFSITVSFSFAQRGKDGNAVIATANKIVNEYTTLTADAAIGATSITVAANGLNANSRFGVTLAGGDLILIIQMQGVTMSGIAVAVGGGVFYGFPLDNTLGDITSYNNCGNYEFCEVSSITGGATINIVCGLQHSYTAAGRVQIVRVQRYNTLTINSPGSITCPAWGGTFVGGVVAIEVLGNTTISAGTSIYTTALGFRGGAVGPMNNAGYGGGQMATTSFNEGAEKGEGVGGYQNDYNINGGRYCRGAFANAGGGGDSHNSGGGGGSNAGSLIGWDGLGNPDISTGSWAAAWNLESAGFSTHTSPGGGKGGYSFASSNRNALVEGPWVSGTNLWNGDFRRNNGGMGGRPLDYSTGRLFMGGGGGSGDYDDNAGGGGAKGGGLIYIMSYGAISGAGAINANGANGGNAGGSGIDAAGGAGAGGTIVLNSVGTISGITANANGGTGGNQSVGGFVIESEGPGGGGGGGYIAISNGAITRNTNGGNNGTTNSNSLSEFPPNGATKGAAGTNNASIPTLDTLTTTDVTICTGNTATLSATVVGPVAATINWYSTATGGASIGTGNTFTTPVLAATTTYYAGFCPGTYRKPVVVTVVASLPITVNSPAICPGQTANLTANGGTTYSWSAGATVTGVNTADVSPAATTTYTVTGTTASCSGTAVATVTITPLPTITVNSPSICPGQTATLTANGGTSYTWSAGATPTGVSTASASPVVTTTYTVTGTASGCSNTATATVTITPLPTITVNSPTICAGQTANLTANGGTSYSWSAGATSTGVNTADATPPATATFTVTGTNAGCSNTAVSTVTVTSLPTITVNSPTICAGQTASLTANGGTSYSWSAGATSTGVNTADAAPAITTTYTVTGTSASCSNTAISSVTITPLPTITVNSPTICLGQTAALTANGGTSYSWSAGATSTGVNTADATPAITTTYTVTGTASGCSNTATSTVTITSLPTITVNSPTICAGQTANLTANGGTSYTWSAGATSTGVNTADATPAATSTYTVTGSASGGCSNTATSTVTITPLPVITVNSPTICAGQTVNLTANGGTSYTWSAGATSTGVNTANAIPAATSTYTVTGTVGSCSNTAISTVTITPLPTITVNSPTICPSQTAILTANGGTSYTWSTGATSTGINTADATPVATTTYTVTGTSSGCSNTAVSTVTIAPNLAITVNSPAICIGQTANLSASGGTTYTWTAGAVSTGANTADASPLITTTYTVTGTTGFCTGTAISTVTVNPLPTITVNSPTICSGQTASLIANGGTSYTWSAGATSTGINTADASPLATITFTVTGSDAVCSNTAISTVTVTPLPVITVNSPAICTGQTANLTANGGTSYTWSTGATSTGVNTADATPGATSTFTVTGTTGTCSNTASSTVTVNPLPTITVNSPTICPGQTASLSANGGTSYTWSAGAASTGVNTADATPAITTSYTVTGTSTGCSNTAVATVTIAPALAITVNSPAICSGQTANLSANGGTSYTWTAGANSTGVNTADATPVITTTYTVTGTTGTCSGTASATVTVNALPTITVNSPTVCIGQTATLTANGGTSYTWSAGATSTGINTADASPAITTSYTVTGTSGTCSTTATATVTITPLPVITVNSPTICEGQIANLSANGGTSYTWSAGATSTGVNTADATPASNTSYTVTGTNTGCSDTAVATVTVTSLPVITVNSPNICEGQTANLSANGGTSYTWSSGTAVTGTSTADATPAATATFTVTGTANGCSNTAISTVTVTPLPLTTVNSPSICPGETANLTATGGTSYTWSAGATSTGISTANAAPTVTTSYTVTGTTNGCSATAVATVTITIISVTVNSPTICFGQTATLTASGATTYTWSGGATSTGVNTAITPTLTTTSTFTVVGTFGTCTDTAFSSVTIGNCNPPTANFTASPLIICSAGCIDVLDLSTDSPTTWNWSFPGGTPSSASSQGTAHVCYSAPGDYSITLIVSNSQGSDTLTKTNYIHIVEPVPVIITGNTSINSCEIATLTAQPSGLSYQWGGIPTTKVNCDQCQTATASPKSTQQFYVNYTDVNGCPAGDTTTVTVTEIYTYYMPTAVAPNSVLGNEELHVHGRGIESIDLKIFSRIGTKVFETTDMTEGWDATYHGVPLNDNVYTYTLRVEFCNGQVADEKGNITIVK